jgi:hypothetical protein
LSDVPWLRVEKVGAAVKTGPMTSVPGVVERVTVRLPVTATALVGMGSRPLTWNWRGASE